MSNDILYSVGHSNHSIDDFIALLKRHDIEAVADVRSAPYSRYNPQYNKESLQQSLKAAGIAYVFLGRELGARREEEECYRDGKVDFERLQLLPAFLNGIKRLQEGAGRMRVAMMCAEKDPLNCHRTGFIVRYLADSELAIEHILADGSLLTHEALLEESIDHTADGSGDLFSEL